MNETNKNKAGTHGYLDLVPNTEVFESGIEFL